MNWFEVDREKCRRDKLCREECPGKLIYFPEEDSFPTPIEGLDQFCISCGHCMAICPQGAFSLAQVASDAWPKIDRDLLPSAAQTEMLLKSRRSVRSFQDRTLERAVLKQLIEAARYAPSAHNEEPVHWMIIEESKTVKRISGMAIDWMRWSVVNQPELAGMLCMQEVVIYWDNGTDIISHGAPHIVLTYGPKENEFISQSACVIALSHLELAAYSMGLGACWAGFIGLPAATFPPLIEELAVPEGYQVYGAMLIGYPKYHYQRIPVRHPARITWK